MAHAYVELSIMCCNLPDKTSDSAVICCLFQKDDSWTKVDQTEVVYKTNNPRFAERLKIKYCAGEQHYYRLAVYAAKTESLVETFDEKLMIAGAEFTNNELFTSAVKQEFNLTSQGAVIPNATVCIWAEPFDCSKYDITMQLFCTKLQKKDAFGSKVDSFLEISKLQKDGMFILVHRTDVVYSSANPRWSTFSEPIWKLCSNQWERQLLFCIYQWRKSGKHEVIGYFYSSLEEICSQEEHINSEVREIKLMSKGRRKYDTVGTLHFASVRAIPVYSIHDYILNGFDINLTVAIDYTESNGAPASPNSLHHIKQDQDNEYVYCLKALASVMDEFKYYPMVAAYGFGACLLGSEVVSNCFPLNGNIDDPYIDGTKNVIKAYKDQLQSVRLHGPTNYSQILDKVIEQAVLSVTKESKAYHHLVILTDGVVNDKAKFVNRIVLASSLPISVTIIGVGAADFSMLDTYNSSPIVDSHGKPATQTILEFIPLRKCIHARGTLSSQIEATLSSQFLNYMKVNAIKPKKFRPSLSSLSSAVSLSSDWQPYIKRVSTSSATMSSPISTLEQDC